MSRIELTDTTMSALVKMAEGNPGALTAMMDILDKHESIDPQAFMGGLGAIMALDTYEIYGTDIYVLYSDKCGRDVRTMLMLMRATQLGFYPVASLKALAADQTRDVNISAEALDALDVKVCKALEEFAKN